MIGTTPFFRLLAHRRLAHLNALDPVTAQSEQLMQLVRRAQDTRFGQDHGFAQIKTVADFQERVPLRAYDDFWTDYWNEGYPNTPNMTWPGLTRFWALSSGTSSGTTKYIPCTMDMVASNKKAALDILCYQLGQMPAFRPTDGKTFILGGSTDLSEPTPGFFAGDLSGIAAKTVPLWAKPFTFPPTTLSLIKDWEEKLDTLARRSLTERIRVLSGTPIWLLLLFRKVQSLLDEAGVTDRAPFPHLQLLIHGGTSYAPYEEETAPFLDRVGAGTREVYPASEGFLAIADRGNGEGLRLNMDIGLFFEFIPVEELEAANPARHWVGTLETGVNYAVALSSCAGVFSYLLGDVVRFVDRAPPRLVISGRTAYTLSAFGEHLIGEEIEGAILNAAKECGLHITEFSVGTTYGHQTNDSAAHTYFLETASETKGANIEALQNSLSERIDQDLKDTNDDYLAHRKTGLTLKPPQVHIVPPNSFSAWMKARGKLGGQNKVPRVINDRALFENLSAFMIQKAP